MTLYAVSPEIAGPMSERTRDAMKLATLVVGMLGCDTSAVLQAAIAVLVEQDMPQALVDDLDLLWRASLAKTGIPPNQG